MACRGAVAFQRLPGRALRISNRHTALLCEPHEAGNRTPSTACFGGCLKCGHVGRPPSQLGKRHLKQRDVDADCGQAQGRTIYRISSPATSTHAILRRESATPPTRVPRSACRARRLPHTHSKQWTLPPLFSRIRALPTMRTFRTTRPRRPPASRRFWRPLPAHAQQSPSRPRLIRR